MAQRAEARPGSSYAPRLWRAFVSGCDAPHSCCRAERSADDASWPCACPPMRTCWHAMHRHTDANPVYYPHERRGVTLRVSSYIVLTLCARHYQGRMDWTDGSSFEGLWRHDLVCPGTSAIKYTLKKNQFVLHSRYKLRLCGTNCAPHSRYELRRYCVDSAENLPNQHNICAWYLSRALRPRYAKSGTKLSVPGPVLTQHHVTVGRRDHLQAQA